MLLWQNFENWMQLAIFHTARKTIFFSGRPTKMVFLEKLPWNMIFLVLSGKVIYPFPEKMILHLWHKMKNDLSKKIHGNLIFSSGPPKKMVFPKGAVLARDLSYIIWKDGFLFQRTWSFFIGQKAKDGLSKEIDGDVMHRPAKKKTGNLIYRNEASPLLKFIRSEIPWNE